MPAKIDRVVEGFTREMVTFILRQLSKVPLADLESRGERTRFAARVAHHDLVTVDELVHRYVRFVLRHAHGNKTAAAAILGFDRRTLNRGYRVDATALDGPADPLFAQLFGVAKMKRGKGVGAALARARRMENREKRKKKT
jgi:hypothetical protein